jgi:hypothetical protein
LQTVEGTFYGAPPSYVPLSNSLVRATFDLLVWPVQVDPHTYEAEVMADQPWAYWRFAEASGTQAFDFTGHGRHLNVASGAVVWSQTPNETSGSLSAFIGSGTRIDREPFFFGDVDITVEAWFRSSDPITSSPTIFSIGGPTDDTSGAYNWQFMLSVLNDGVVRIFWEHGTGENDVFEFESLVVTPGGPAYIVAGRDTTNGVVFARLNDSAIVTMPYSTPPDGGLVTRMEVGNKVSDDFPAEGNISHVVVHDRVIYPDRYGDWHL